MIAIHDYPKDQQNFCRRWLKYCQEHDVPYKIVDCHSSSIIDDLRDAKTLLWHWGQDNLDSIQCARQIIFAAEKMGLQVFPNSPSALFYDDKVGQKYLFEALNLPLIKTDVFYDQQKALQWLSTQSFPIVAKLRSGSGSRNVFLLENKKEAVRHVRRSFTSGYRHMPGFLADLNTRAQSIAKSNLLKRISNIPKNLARIRRLRQIGPVEKGYVYFQSFMPGNDCDIRVVVVGDRAFAFRRFVRKNDFRASGSGKVDCDPNQIPMVTIKQAFKVSDAVKAQSIALDFLFNREQNQYMLIEMSYCFSGNGAVPKCPGHWNRNLQFVPGKLWPQDLILQNLLPEYK